MAKAATLPTHLRLMDAMGSRVLAADRRFTESLL